MSDDELARLLLASKRYDDAVKWAETMQGEADAYDRPEAQLYLLHAREEVVRTRDIVLRVIRELVA